MKRGQEAARLTVRKLHILAQASTAVLMAVSLYPLLSTLHPLFAGGVGTTAAPFLKIGMGARAEGLAGAYSAMAEDPTAIYWNPACLATLRAQQVNLDFARHFQDVGIGHVAYAGSLGSHDLGASLTYLRIPDIERRSTTDAVGIVPKDGEFSASDMALSLAYARKDILSTLVERLDAGVAVKFIRSAIDDEAAVAGAVDLGAQYRATDRLRLGFVLQNLGTPMKFKSESDPLPATLRTSAAFQAGKNLELAAQLDESLLEEKLYASVGAEQWVRGAFALRGGYRFGYDTGRLGAEAGVSLGFGIQVQGLGIDYAFLPFGDLGQSHRFGFWISF